MPKLDPWDAPEWRTAHLASTLVPWANGGRERSGWLSLEPDKSKGPCSAEEHLGSLQLTVVDRLTLQVDAVYTGVMARPLDVINQGFTAELARHVDVDEHPPDVSAEELYDLGRRAARMAIAPLVWGAQVGERWDVRGVTEFLEVSRQAVYKRLRSGSLLGLPGSGTTWFPVWQFDPEHHVVRHVVASVIGAFREADTEVDPLVIATWATSKSSSLGSKTPAELMAAGRQDESVVLAAARAARGLAA